MMRRSAPSAAMAASSPPVPERAGTIRLPRPRILRGIRGCAVPRGYNDLAVGESVASARLAGELPEEALELGIGMRTHLRQPSPLWDSCWSRPRRCSQRPVPIEAPRNRLACSLIPARSSSGCTSAPGASLKGYQRVRLDPVQVAFAKNWDPNGSQCDPSRGLPWSDREAIHTHHTTEFRKVFVGTLAKGGCPPGEAADDDVLRVTETIMDLYITAPGTTSPGWSRTHAQDTDRRTLRIELRDPTTGQVLAPTVDAAQGSFMGGQYEVSSSVTNSADARPAIATETDLLRAALGQAGGQPDAR
jgi:hypothetical protein